MVVGKSGEEIWTDKYGRVKVQFLWDREGEEGREQLLLDPRRPGLGRQRAGARSSHPAHRPGGGRQISWKAIPTGRSSPARVYNAEQMPPYALPDEQTKSTIKSMSSKGGGGFNEIRFEDKKGSEAGLHPRRRRTSISVSRTTGWSGSGRTGT